MQPNCQGTEPSTPKASPHQGLIKGSQSHQSGVFTPTWGAGRARLQRMNVSSSMWRAHPILIENWYASHKALPRHHILLCPHLKLSTTISISALSLIQAYSPTKAMVEEPDAELHTLWDLNSIHLSNERLRRWEIPFHHA